MKEKKMYVVWEVLGVWCPVWPCYASEAEAKAAAAEYELGSIEDGGRIEYRVTEESEVPEWEAI